MIKEGAVISSIPTGVRKRQNREAEIKPSKEILLRATATMLLF